MKAALMFRRNAPGCFTSGPAIVTHGFFGTLNSVEKKLNEE